MRHPGLAITRFAIKVSPNGAIQHGAKSIMAFIVDLTALGIAHKGAIFHMGADIILWTAGNLLEAGLLLVAKHLTHTTVAPSGIIQIRALDESPTISWVGHLIPRLEAGANLRELGMTNRIGCPLAGAISETV